MTATQGHTPWAPEREVDATEARALVEAAFPDLAPARVASLGAGWDNTAYLVNDAWVVRFPRREIAVGWLRAELAVLPRLAARLPLPIPSPALVAEGVGGYPWPFAGHRALPGRTADRAGLDDEGRLRAAGPLGAFLGALHSVGAEEARRLGAREDPMGRLDPAVRAPRARAELALIAELGLADHRAALEPVLAPPAGLRPAGATALVHGDLYSRHVLVDDGGSPCGVIDWGDVHLGDPAADLAIAHAMLPAAARPAFLAAYGPVDEATWALARFRAAYHSASVVRYAHAVGDAPLRAEGLGSLERVAAGG